MKEINKKHSRVDKLFVESGLGDFEEAERFYDGLTLRVHLDEAEADKPAAQAAVLTAVATGVRCFRGGVTISGKTDQPLLLPLPFETIGEAAVAFGAVAIGEAICSVIVGNTPHEMHGWAVRTWWNGWLAGIRPADDNQPSVGGRNVLAGIAAGALAVSQAFSYAQGDLRAGRFAQTVSLWNPADSEDAGESKVFLPKALWLIGLGNLGQAYLWSLSMLPYVDRKAVDLVLQDFDVVKEENWATSILTTDKDYGLLKTRLAENWALSRGFNVKRYDRKFDQSVKRQEFEPAYALSGLDSLEVRKILGEANFDFVLDCGLGGTARDYHVVRFNVFDKNYTSHVHFADQVDGSAERLERTKLLPAYQKQLVDAPHTVCGVAEIAGANIAVPFVSAFLGALAIAQTIRIASNQAPCRSMAGSILNIQGINSYIDPDLKSGNAIYSEMWDC